MLEAIVKKSAQGIMHILSGMLTGYQQTYSAGVGLGSSIRIAPSVKGMHSKFFMSTKMKTFLKITLKAVIKGIIIGIIVVVILRLTGR